MYDGYGFNSHKVFVARNKYRGINKGNNMKDLRTEVEELMASLNKDLGDYRDLPEDSPSKDKWLHGWASKASSVKRRLYMILHRTKEN